MDRREHVENIRKIFYQAGAGAVSPSDIALLLAYIDQLERHIEDTDQSGEAYWQKIMAIQEAAQKRKRE